LAYTHSKQEIVVVKDGSLATAADIGHWASGLIPHVIRAVALVFTTAVDATGQVSFDKRPTVGSDTGRGNGDVAVINYTSTTGAQGKVVYKEGLNIEIAPGEEVVAQVTDATPTAGNAHVILYVEPRWERPANNIDMSATT